MWPFRRKKAPAAPPAKTTPEGVRRAPQTPESGPGGPTKTADDILRQLDAQGASERPRPRERPAKPASTTPTPVDPALGRFLLAEGPVTREFIHKQLAVSGRADSPIAKLLTASPAPRQAELFRLLAAGYTVPQVDLKELKVQVAAARSIPREVALKYKIVPVDRIGDLLCVVFAGEPNPKALEAVRRATGLSLKALRCPPHHIDLLLRRLYAKARTTKAPASATPAIPINEREHHEVAAGTLTRAEARWEGLHASKGPVRATRLTRR